MSSPLLAVPWEGCLLEPCRDRGLEAFARRHLGTVPPPVQYLAPRPWVVRTFIALSPENGLLVNLDLGLADVVALVVSQENSCRFCYAATRTLMRIRGWSEARIDELEQRLATPRFDPRLAAAVEFARRLTRAAPLPDERDRRALLDAGFSRVEVNELAFVVAYLALANRLSTIVAMPTQMLEELADRWFVKLLRPVIARQMDRHRRAGRATGAPVPHEGPYDAVVRAYAGSPIAQALVTSLEEVHASNVLSGRCRALIFGVVAHGLGCDVSAEESLRMLCALDGNTDRDCVRRALEHLEAPELAPHENPILAFARETIRYTPQQIQRRARALQGSLSREQFVEVVGLTAFANALCRLAAAVVERP